MKQRVATRSTFRWRRAPARVVVEADFNDRAFPGSETPLLVFNREFAIADAGAAISATWNISTSNVVISGVMATSDGVVRADDGFDWTATSYIGGTGGAVLGAVSGSEYTFTGNYSG